MNWSDKTEVKKGNIGERLVRRYLVSQDLIPYLVDSVVNKSHPFDMLGASLDKNTIFIAEVKTKARLYKYNGTGFNLKHFNIYKSIVSKYNIPLFIFFVDDVLKAIYGERLDVICRKIKDKYATYPMLLNSSLIIFSLENMKILKRLSTEDIKKIRLYSKTDYKKYNNIKPSGMKLLDIKESIKEFEFYIKKQKEKKIQEYTDKIIETMNDTVNLNII